MDDPILRRAAHAIRVAESLTAPIVQDFAEYHDGLTPSHLTLHEWLADAVEDRKPYGPDELGQLEQWLHDQGHSLKVDQFTLRDILDYRNQ